MEAIWPDRVISAWHQRAPRDSRGPFQRPSCTREPAGGRSILLAVGTAHSGWQRSRIARRGAARPVTISTVARRGAEDQAEAITL